MDSRDGRWEAAWSDSDVFARIKEGKKATKKTKLSAAVWGHSEPQRRNKSPSVRRRKKKNSVQTDRQTVWHRDEALNLSVQRDSTSAAAARPAELKSPGPGQ